MTRFPNEKFILPFLQFGNKHKQLTKTWRNCLEMSEMPLPPCVWLQHHQKAIIQIFCFNYLLERESKSINHLGNWLPYRTNELYYVCSLNPLPPLTAAAQTTCASIFICFRKKINNKFCAIDLLNHCSRRI